MKTFLPGLFAFYFCKVEREGGQLDKGVTIDDRASAGGSRATVHDRRSTAAEEESGI